MRKLLLSLVLSLGAGAGYTQERPLTTPLPTADITKGSWVLQAIDGEIVDFHASFAIDADGKVTGQAPCNRYFSTNQHSIPALTLDTLGVTRMACPLLAEEDRFLKILTEIRSLEIIGTLLVLNDAVGPRLTFIRDQAGNTL